MAKIEVTRAHELSLTEARERLEPLAKAFSDKYGGQWDWRSETEARLARPGLRGKLLIEATEVRVSVDLSFAMSPFTSGVERLLTDGLSCITARLDREDAPNRARSPAAAAREALEAALLEHFLEALAARLGRAACELRREGLRAGDFHGKVRVEFEDGSQATFESALAEADDDLVGVFTEHCGHVAFDAHGVSSVWRDEREQD